MGKGGKKKHQKAPYETMNEETEVSSDTENVGDEGGGGGETSLCPHVGKAVFISGIKKATKTAMTRIGVCQPCSKEKRQLTSSSSISNSISNSISTSGGGRGRGFNHSNTGILKKSISMPTSMTLSSSSSKLSNGTSKSISETSTSGPTSSLEFNRGTEIYICLRCGVQSCSTGSPNEPKTHSCLHYSIVRSELHCISLNINTWVLYCHQCNRVIPVDSYKKLREAVEFLKKLKKTKGVTASTNLMNGKNGGKLTKSSSLLITKNPLNGTLMAQQLPRVRGLTNLGNTCFFNAVIQCLSQSHPLIHVLDRHCQKNAPFNLPSIYGSREKLWEANQLSLMESGPITLSLAAFLKEMNSHGKSGVFNPGHLFGQVCRRSPQFRGYHQEDAHELLRQLMEGLRTEEVKRQKSAILKTFGLSEKTDPKTVAPSTKKKLQALARHSNFTVVDKLFGGQLVSTIVCEQCHSSSQMYESFLDISLPLIEEKSPRRPSKIHYGDDVDSSSISCFGKSNLTNRKSKAASKKEKKEKRKNKKNNNFLKKSIIDEKTNIEDKSDTTRNEEEQKDGPEALEVNVESNNEVELDENLLTKIESIPENDDGADNNRRDKLIQDNNIKNKVNLFNEKSTVNKPVLKKDGNEEDSEDDGDEEDDEDWEWYEAPAENPDGEEEDEEENSKENEEEDTIDETESEKIPVKLESLNPIKPEILAEMRGGSSEREKSSVEKEVDSDVDEETGASSNADVEDNVEFIGKRKYEPFNPDSQCLDPHMEQLCRKVRSLSVATAALDLDENQLRKYSITTMNGAVENPKEEEEEKDNVDDDYYDDEINKQKKKIQLENDWIARSLTSIAPRYTSSAGECSVYSCLTQFTAPELLTGNNKWACENCTKIAHSLKNNTNYISSDNDDDDNEKSNNEEEEKMKTVYSNASKQILIFSPPAILTIHLKRFQQTMTSLRKINKHVGFPLNLNLAPFASSTSISTSTVDPETKSIDYYLFGVVEHSGRLHGGHYTAYVKVRPSNMKQDFNRFYSSPTVQTQEIQNLLQIIENKFQEYRNKNVMNQDDINKNDDDDSKPANETSFRWYHVSDSSVSEASEDKVLKSQAYILFYERFN